MSAGGGLVGRLCFGKGGLHLEADGFHEGLARGETLGVNGGQELDGGGSWKDLQASFAKHVGGALDDHGDHGDIGLGGEEEGTFFEGQEVAVGRAGAFGEDEDVHAAAQGVGGDGYTLLGFSAGVAARYGDVLGHTHGNAEEGDIHQGPFEEDAAHAGDGGQEDGWVEVGDVVAQEDAGLVGWDILCAGNDDADAASAEAGAHGEHGPAVHDADVALEERERNAYQGGGQAEEGDNEEHAERCEHGDLNSGVENAEDLSRAGYWRV